MFKPTLTVTTLAAIVFTLSHADITQAESISRIKLLADVCGVCHGTDGRGAGKIPKINEGEVKVGDFNDTMHGFASGEERSTVMGSIAKGLPEGDFKLLADYFSTLKP